MVFELPVLSEARPLDGLMADLLPSARKLLGMEVAFVSQFYEGRRVFRYIDSQEGFTPIQVGGSDPLEDSYCQRVVDGRLPELLPDAGQNAEALTLAATRALPVGAHLSVPIKFSNGRVFGTFCCFSREPDPTLGGRDLATMRFFADIVGRVLEQRETETARQRERADCIQGMMARHEYAMAFQPIWDIRANRVVGFEALARFKSDPYRTPDLWIADAVATGMAQALERLLHQEAMRQLAQLPAGTYLSLNVTPATILSEGFAEGFAGQPLDRLVLEITEQEAVSDYERIAAALAPLRAQGLRLAVDDAGAGFSSFRHILRLKADIIKLDRSLIQHIDTESDGRVLAAALVQFADQVGSQVVAEGVETEAELKALRALGVRLVQGYLLGKPQAAADLAAFCQRN